MAKYALAVGLLVFVASGLVLAYQEGMEPPRPAQQHQFLNPFVGTWDARARFEMEPGKPAMELKGSETSSLLGEIWLVTDFTGRMEDKDFRGHGIMGYDLTAKKYVGCWVDTMETRLMLSEGTYDESSRTFTMISKVTGPDGKTVEIKQVQRIKDRDHRDFSLIMPGPDGKEREFGRIEYTRVR